MKLKLNQIKIRPERQRKDLGDLSELKDSILQVGLINAVVVEPAEEPDTYYLIAGERRLTSWTQLVEEGKLEDSISANLFTDLDEPTRQLIELEENVKRKDLTWQEYVQAVVKLYNLKGFKSNVEAEAYLGISDSMLSRITQVHAQLDNPRVAEAQNLSAAYTIVHRENARTLDNMSLELTDFFQNTIKEEPQNVTTISKEISLEPKPSTSPSQVQVVDTKQDNYRIQQGDFKTWATSYRGKPFDLLHLDFPYGINHDRSQQGNTAAYGTYEDSEDIYKELVRTLLDNQDSIVAPKAHCICWLSYRYAEWTKQEFAKAGWGCHMQPLIWHKSDNKGIIADTQCGFRNVGEYALFFNRGRKTVVKNVSNIYSGPTTKRFHASEKPLPMLKHFFSGLCDHHSRVLDPTCGSGTSIMAAEFYGAEEALGLELNAEFAKKAQEYLRSERNKNPELIVDLEDIEI